MTDDKKQHIPEWSDPINAFNSHKIWLWRDRMENVVAWLEGEAELMPPIQCDTNPSNLCNHNCVWCNAWQLREVDNSMLSRDQLLSVADFYPEWGVKATCVAGGGEPFLNPHVPEFFHRLKENGIEIGTISNGSIMNHEIAEAIADTCRWCGFSIDAGTAETFSKLKGVPPNRFEKVVENMHHLVSTARHRNSDLRLTYKYLIHPENVDGVGTAAKIAKQIGCHDIQFRPVGWDNLYITNGKPPLKYDMEAVNREIENAFSQEDDNFRVFGIRHKFSPEMQRIVRFKKCRACVFVSTLGANGNVYICFDRKEDEPGSVLCHYIPDLTKIRSVWGSDRHRELVKSIDPNKCPRCTMNFHNETIERVIINDEIFINFP